MMKLDSKFIKNLKESLGKLTPAELQKCKEAEAAGEAEMAAQMSKHFH